MIRGLLIGCLLLLSACSSHAPLPERTLTLALPLQLHIERQLAGQRQDWLLVIQRENSGIRWSMMDPLGIPWPASAWSMASGRPTVCYHRTPKPGSCSPRYCSP